MILSKLIYLAGNAGVWERGRVLPQQLVDLFHADLDEVGVVQEVVGVAAVLIAVDDHLLVKVVLLLAALGEVFHSGVALGDGPGLVAGGRGRGADAAVEGLLLLIVLSKPVKKIYKVTFDAIHAIEKPFPFNLRK